MLNWEKDKVNHKATEVSHDYLPRTGSWADMRRWEIENDQKRVSRNQSNRQTTTKVNSSYRTDNLNQLSSYVNCVNSAYFLNKSSKDKNEIVMIIRKLLRRISDLNVSLTQDHSTLISKAQKIIIKHSH